MATETEFVLQDRNGDKFTCEVESSVGESMICLTNTTTNALWTCKLTSSDLTQYHDSGIRLANLHRVVMTLLQDVFQGNLKRKSVIKNQNGGYASLKQGRCPYCMNLMLACYLDGKKGRWLFPMVPKDPVAIMKREEEVASVEAKEEA